MQSIWNAPVSGANGTFCPSKDHSARRIVFALCVLAFGVAGEPARAQSTLGPSGDWNGTYGFASSTDQNLRLLRSDIIRKSEEGFYESLGRVQVDNHVTDNSVTQIGQQQTTIGVLSTSTNTVDISNSAGASVGAENVSGNSGCVESHVSIDSRPAGPMSRTCR